MRANKLTATLGKLDIVRSLRLPPDILKPHHPELIQRFRRRVATESVWELRRHPERIRLPLLVFYCAPREAEIIDGLVELLLEITTASRFGLNGGSLKRSSRNTARYAERPAFCSASLKLLSATLMASCAR